MELKDSQNRRQVLRLLATGGSTVGFSSIAQSQVVTPFPDTPFPSNNTATPTSADESTETANVSSESGNWPQFGFDIRNSGHNPNTVAPQSSVSQQWAFNTGKFLSSSPAIVDGTVFVGNDKLYAIEASSGEQNWAFETENDEFSSPAVADGSVFVGSSDNDDNNLYAVDKATGEQRWAFDTSDAVPASPTVRDSTVFFGAFDNNLYAVDESFGEQRWAFDTGGALRFSPSIADGSVFVGNQNSRLYAVDIDTGNQQWVFQMEGSPTSPAVLEGSVFVGSWSDTKLYAVDASTGEPEWLFQTDDWVGSPAVAQGTVFVGSRDNFLYALDATTGKQQWAYETGANVQSSPAIADGLVFIGSDDGKLHVVDSSTGEQQWVFEPGARVRSAPAVVNGSVYFGSGNGNLYAVSDTPTSTEAKTTIKMPETKPSIDEQTQTTIPTVTSDSSNYEYFEEGSEPTWRDDISEPRVMVGIGTLLGSGLTYGAIRWRRSPNEESPFEDEADPGDRFDEFVGTAGGQVEKTPREGQPPQQIPTVPDRELTYDTFNREAPIGKGGNADVYRAIATDHPDQLTVALKEPRFEGTLHQETVDRFTREAKTWERLDDHDHIVAVIDWDTEPLPWIAMEYMDAGDLSGRSGDLTFPQAVWTAGRITEGIRHAHEHGVIHLDLKPSNILLRETGQDYWDVPKIGDWGLAKLLLEHSKSVEELSPEYAAPEQFDPDEFGGTDKRTDIYQLGSIFYELFVGEPAFEGAAVSVLRSKLDGDMTPPSIANPALPAALDDVLLDAMAVQKVDRYDSVIAFRNELRDLLDQL